MKKFILFVVIFFSTIIIVDFVYGKITDYMISHAKGGTIKQLVDICDKNHYDMLIMGSSKAHHNYIPQILHDSLGMTCYNAGYDGNGIILAFGLLNLIDDERLPKWILYDVKQQFDIYQYSGDGDYTRYYKMLKMFYGNPTVDGIIKSISYNDLIKLKSNLYKTNGNLVSILSGYLWEADSIQKMGYQPSVGFLSDDSEQKKDYSNELDNTKIEYFKKFVTMIKKKNIDLVVVFSPEFNSPFSKDFQPIRDICYVEGVPVLDYYKDPTFQNRVYYKDHCHLNEVGAEKFSEKVAIDIKNIRLLKKQN